MVGTVKFVRRGMAAIETADGDYSIIESDYFEVGDAVSWCQSTPLGSNSVDVNGRPVLVYFQNHHIAAADVLLHLH